jgi:hypothetical protein
MAKNLLLIVLAGMFLGCTTVGRQFDTNAVNHIAVGKTTKSEVMSLVGAPMSDEKLSNGINIYKYSYGISAPCLMVGSIATLQVQFYNGVVINKSQRLANF